MAEDYWWLGDGEEPPVWTQEELAELAEIEEIILASMEPTPIDANWSDGF